MATQRTWSFNWRKSPAHLALLTTFLSPRLPDDKPTDIDWTMVLGETHSSAVERFFVQGALVNFYPAKDLLEQFTVDFLKHLLRLSGLAVSGRKEDLVSRVIDAKIQLTRCTDYGRKFAEPYLANPEIRPAAGFTVEMVESLFKWLGTTVTTGVVGNAVYDLIKKVFDNTLDSQLQESGQDDGKRPAQFITPSSVPSDPYNNPSSSSPSYIEESEPNVSAVTSAYDYLLLADESSDTGNYRQAIQYYTEAIRLDSSFLYTDFAYHHRAIAHRKLGQYRQALADYNKAISFSSNNPGLYYNRSVTYYYLKDYKRQIADLSEAIRLDPGHANAHFYRGLAYRRLRDHKRAAADLSVAAKLGHRSAKSELKDLQREIKSSASKRSKRH